MRMTNKIMQNNSLYNVNNNKVLQDKLSTQMSTQKKLTRPSDDPVIAIRALRLRTSVSELTQYYEKNAPDADAWLSVTEKALGTGVEVLNGLIKQANKAANKDLGAEDLNIIVTQMKALKDEYYSTGNVDYAGRYVFTGYRTDTTLSFTDEVENDDVTYDYKIKEPISLEGFDTINYTDMSVLDGITRSNYDAGSYDTVIEQDIQNGDIYRVRLAYDDLKEKNVTIGGITATATPIGSTPDPYAQMLAVNDDATAQAIFIPETGEILLNKKAYKDITDALPKGGTVDVDYEKDEWKDGDLRPEHFFQCTADITKAGNTVSKKFNFDADVNDQIIEYDVGYNQKIRVNTTAAEAFTHGLDRDIDDLTNMIENLTNIGASVEDLKAVKSGMSEDDPKYELVTKQLDAAQKAYSYVRESAHNMFEKTISSFQGYLDETNIAVTDNGTRSNRLDLISNRLMDQKTTFQTLQSENEDADIAEVAIQLTSTELTYEAALMATGKIMQTSLMNYI